MEVAREQASLVVEQGAYIALRNPDCIDASHVSLPDFYHTIATLDPADMSTLGTYHPLSIWLAMALTLTSESGAKDTANHLAVTERLRKMNRGAERKSKPQRRVMRQSSGVDHCWVFCRREEDCRWTSCQPSHISPRGLPFVRVFETLKKNRFPSSSFLQESESQL
jgi:hypothetical protein